MKQHIMKLIAMERCAAGWHVEAIDDEQQNLCGQEDDKLSRIYWGLIRERRTCRGTTINNTRKEP